MLHILTKTTKLLPIIYHTISPNPSITITPVSHIFSQFNELQILIQKTKERKSAFTRKKAEPLTLHHHHQKSSITIHTTFDSTSIDLAIVIISKEITLQHLSLLCHCFTTYCESQQQPKHPPHQLPSFSFPVLACITPPFPYYSCYMPSHHTQQHIFTIPITKNHIMVLN